MLRALLQMALVLGTLAGTLSAQTTQPLFLIERTKNVNKLYYEANLNKSGAIDAKNPVKAFWIMWAKDPTGKTTEALSFLEKKMAYGFNVEPDPSGNFYNMTLKPFKERLIKIYLKDGAARAEMIIAGRSSYFDKMYIYSKGDSKPDSIRLYGTDIENGDSKQESVVPQK